MFRIWTLEFLNHKNYFGPKICSNRKKTFWIEKNFGTWNIFSLKISWPTKKIFDAKTKLDEKWNVLVSNYIINQSPVTLILKSEVFPKLHTFNSGFLILKLSTPLPLCSLCVLSARLCSAGLALTEWYSGWLSLY